MNTITLPFGSIAEAREQAKTKAVQKITQIVTLIRHSNLDDQHVAAKIFDIMEPAPQDLEIVDPDPLRVHEE